MNQLAQCKVQETEQTKDQSFKDLLGLSAEGDNKYLHRERQSNKTE